MDAERKERAWAELNRLLAQGRVERTLLLPVAFGGDAKEPRNVIFLPAAVAARKRAFDARVLAAVRRGLRVRYSATPRYPGDRIVPTRLVLVADGGSFYMEESIDVGDDL